MDKKEIISEHDMTKKMLSSINEMNNPQPEEGISSDNTYELTGTDLEDVKSAFTDQIDDSAVEFNEFYILPETRNAEWSGKFLDNEMEWAFNLTEENGVYITTNQTQLTDGVVERVRLIKAYYIAWQKEWKTNLSQASYQNNAG